MDNAAPMTPYLIPTEPPIMFDHPHSPSVQGKLTTILTFLSTDGFSHRSFSQSVQGVSMSDHPERIELTEVIPIRVG